MGEVLKRGSRWSIRYYDSDGKRCIRATMAATHAEAKRMLLQTEAKISRGVAETEEPTTVTVAELCQQFLAAAHPRAKDEAAYRRIADYALRPVLPLLGTVRLAKLRRKDIEAVRDRLSRRLKPNTVRTALRPLGAALTWAVKQEMIAQSPMTHLELPRRERSTEYLESHEATALLQTAEQRARNGVERDWSSFVGVSLAVRLGLRRGEIFGLRWSEVDLEGKRLTVSRSYDALPKNGKPRSLPLPSALAALLSEWRPRCPTTQKALVCPIGARSQDTLSRLLAAAGCKPLRRGWHSLRHTFASSFIAQGGSIMTLRELLGHSSLEMSLVYSHVAPAALATEVERMKF